MPSGNSESAPRDQASQESPPRESRVVAVVDDDVAVCDSTQILLEIHGFVVRTYQSGAAFLQEQPAISCLVVDYHMPGLNGLEVVAELRRRGSSIPVIMITARADAGIEAQAAQLGIKKVLQKPMGTSLVSALQEEFRED
ncbi:MAG TPA: response regulator [Bradyrhizobium sp.]|nr:response regulator [Bradyrhizobium sp.]